MGKEFFISGMKEVQRALAELPKRVASKVIRQNLRAAMKPMLAAAKENAPEGTGDLEHSIKLKSGKRKRHVIRLNIVAYRDPDDPVPFHAAYVEYGTSRQAPQGFFRRAFDQTKNTTMQLALDGIRKGIDDAVKELAT